MYVGIAPGAAAPAAHGGGQSGLGGSGGAAEGHSACTALLQYQARMSLKPFWLLELAKTRRPGPVYRDGQGTRPYTHTYRYIYMDIAPGAAAPAAHGGGQGGLGVGGSTAEGLGLHRLGGGGAQGRRHPQLPAMVFF